MSWHFQRLIPSGERFPRGYGLAWRCFDRDAAVAYPIPLNVLLGWLRAAYLWLRWDAIPQRRDAALYGAYELGRQDERARRESRIGRGRGD